MNKRTYRFYDPQVEKMAEIAFMLDAHMVLTYMTASVAAVCLAAVTTTGLFMSIHSATPGNTGASEISAYSGTRPAIAWAGASSGVVVSNDTQTYTLTATQSGGIPYFGLWTATSAGTWLFGGPTSGLSGSIPNSAVVTFTSSVTLTQAG
jgi:hypothetical protein